MLATKMFSSILHSSSSSIPTPPVSRPLTPIEGNGSLKTISLSLTKIENDQIKKSCPFEKYGCKFVGNRLSIQEHMRDQNDIHITLIGEKLQPFREEIFEGIEAIKVTHEKAEKIENQAKKLIHCYSSAYMWHIEDYPEKYRLAKKGTKIFVESPKFLTSRFGYAITVFLAPFGDLETSRIYSSIYVSIMPGQHDPVLVWPFTATIIFTLFDQTPASTDHHIVKFVPEISAENMSAFAEPNGKANMKFGLQKFIKITEMEEGGKFVKNGHAFIAINFENLPKCF